MLSWIYTIKGIKPSTVGNNDNFHHATIYGQRNTLHNLIKSYPLIILQRRPIIDRACISWREVMFLFQPAYSITRIHHEEHMAFMIILQQQFGFSVEILCFLGEASDDYEPQSILYKSEIYKDIVQSSFIDSYHSNTHT